MATSRTQCARRLYGTLRMARIGLTLGCLAFAGVSARAADPGGSLEQLVKVLQAQRLDRSGIEARIELQEFIFDEHQELVSSQRVRGDYAADLKAGLYHIGLVEERLDADGEVVEVIEATRSSFDGKNSYRYRKRAGQRGFDRGWIVPGREPTFLPRHEYLPHNAIWSWMGKSIDVADLLEREYLNFEVRTRDGSGLIEVAMVNKESKGYRSVLTLDPQRDYLPVEQISYRPSGLILSRYRMTEFVTTPQGRQVPSEIVADWGDGTPVYKVVRISDISFGDLPAERFRVQFPPGTRVVDQVVGYAYTAGADAAVEDSLAAVDDSVLVAQLDDQVAAAEAQKQATEVGAAASVAAAVPRGRPPATPVRDGWPGPAALALVAAVALAGILIWWAMRRRA